MPKKRKKTTNPRTKRKTTPKKTVEHVDDLEHTLIKNLIELQKVNTNMAEKFDKLSKELSHLLALFEVTARNFAKNVPIGEYEKDKDFLTKIDKLLDQNKTLAKGLMLMEDRLRERMYSGHPQAEEEEAHHEDVFHQSLTTPGKKPLPRF